MPIFENRLRDSIKTFEDLGTCLELGTRFSNDCGMRTRLKVLRSDLVIRPSSKIVYAILATVKAKISVRDLSRTWNEILDEIVGWEGEWKYWWKYGGFESWRSIWACKGLARSTLRVGLEWFRKLDQDVRKLRLSQTVARVPCGGGGCGQVGFASGSPTRGIKFIYISNLDDLHQLSRLDFYEATFIHRIKILLKSRDICKPRN